MSHIVEICTSVILLRTFSLQCSFFVPPWFLYFTGESLVFGAFWNKSANRVSESVPSQLIVSTQCLLLTKNLQYMCHLPYLCSQLA